eukprot:709015-Rhodomonas_salina.1
MKLKDEEVEGAGVVEGIVASAGAADDGEAGAAEERRTRMIPPSSTDAHAATVCCYSARCHVTCVSPHVASDTARAWAQLPGGVCADR